MANPSGALILKVNRVTDVRLEVDMKCPGQDMQFWKPGDIFEARCPQCGGQVEFFKDDTARRCGQCGHRFANPKMDFGCAAYCPYAEQCLGDLPPELVAQQENLFKDRVAVETKRYYGQDFRRIGRTSRAARHAEQMGKTEGGNLAVILSAVYLSEVGFPEAERKYGEAAEVHITEETPAVATVLLQKLKASEPLIEGVTGILKGLRDVGPEASLEARIVHDAMVLGEMESLLAKPSEPSLDTATLLSEKLLTGIARENAAHLIAAAAS